MGRAVSLKDACEKNNGLMSMGVSSSYPGATGRAYAAWLLAAPVEEGAVNRSGFF